ncbi:MAG: DUF1446 domain-containing protein [Rhizobiales bacterium]|nr:DUF1446 domain-containing protein [Hyphomicrobiales bacterium]
MTEKSVRIGCASGFWGDTETATPQLVKGGKLDYLVFDYLSEVTMSILARARAKDPSAGWTKDFVTAALKPSLHEIAARKIKVISNAGGMNLDACRDAVLKLAAEEGLSLNVAIVRGDDLSDRIERLRAQDVRDLDLGIPLPERVWSLNAYLGATPIATALAAGADIVITARCVDSALVLGPLMHEFGWTSDDYDRLAAGSLAGHILECGAQATGGNFTDWQDVEGWEDMGFPIAECYADGRFIITKPENTGGLVTPATVGEQILYELGDPASYKLPDVTCDFRDVRLTQAGPNAVLVQGAKGRTPTSSLKVSATYQDGFRSTALLIMGGFDTAKKAEKVGTAILMRTRNLFRERNLGDYRRTNLTILGTEEMYGAQARPDASLNREAVLRIDVHHDDRRALDLFSREIAPSGTGMAPGRCALVGGRPDVVPLVRLFSFLVPKSDVDVAVEIDDTNIRVPFARGTDNPPPAATPSAPKAANASNEELSATIPLVRIAWGRSGDKGDTSNIGIIARRPDFLPLIRDQVNEKSVAEYFRHFAKGKVRRFDLPGFDALNFTLEHALDGGGIASMRTDPLGKCFAQILLSMPVRVPRKVAQELGS